MSHPKTLMLGTILGGIVTAAILRNPDVPQAIENRVKGALATLSRDIKPAPPTSQTDSFDPRVLQFPVNLVVKQDASMRTRYGIIRISAGTPVEAVGKVQNGVAARFAGHEVIIPFAAFIPPTEVAQASKVDRHETTHSAVPEAKPTNLTLRTSEYARSIIIVDGDNGLGSGFVADHSGRRCVFTNAHVISGNSYVKLRSLSGETLVQEKLYVAKDADVARLPVSANFPPLKVCRSVDTAANIGDEVVVLGNSKGKEVATELRGAIKGIGPRKIEVDAKFVAGNSGSPVILVKTGEVIGIATEAEIPSLDIITQDSPFREVRRFAYRLDVLESWDTPRFSHFFEESQLIEAFREQTEDLYLLAKDITVNRVPTINAHTKRLNRLAIPVLHYYEQISGASPKRLVGMDPQQQLLTRLVFETTSDIALKEQYIQTGYHKSVLKDEVQLRLFLKRAFERLLTQ